MISDSWYEEWYSHQHSRGRYVALDFDTEMKAAAESSEKARVLLVPSHMVFESSICHMEQ